MPAISEKKEGYCKVRRKRSTAILWHLRGEQEKVHSPHSRREERSIVGETASSSVYCASRHWEGGESIFTAKREKRLRRKQALFLDHNSVGKKKRSTASLAN